MVLFGTKLIFVPGTELEFGKDISAAHSVGWSLPEKVNTRINSPFGSSEARSTTKDLIITLSKRFRQVLFDHKTITKQSSSYITQ